MDGYDGDVGCTRSVVSCCSRNSDKFKGKKREEKELPHSQGARTFPQKVGASTELQAMASKWVHIPG